MNTINCIVISFAPDKWGTHDLFKNFYRGTYTFTPDIQYALSGAANHFHKALILLQVAREHIARLNEDKEQLEKYGYTPAQRGKELSALIESILLDLYSSVDCTRKIVTFIYKSHRGVKQSTRKFFQAVKEGKVEETVPVQIRDAFASAHWYSDFRRMRDALTHSDIGACHLDDKSAKVSYMHGALATNTRALVIDDIFSHIDNLIAEINQFMEKIFHFLNSTLEDRDVWQICGIFDGRVYSRWVRPSEAKDFNSGICDSFKWFEKDENPKCPFIGKCEAYGRRNSEQINPADPEQAPGS